MKTYNGWELYEVLPYGWKVDKSCGSPLCGYDFCTNGKSMLNGGKRGLVRTVKTGTPLIQFIEKTFQGTSVVREIKDKENYRFPAKTVNTLARKKFQEHLLREIQFDLMVCEIEGWDKKEYIRELKKLINGIKTTNNKVNSTAPSLFQ